MRDKAAVVSSALRQQSCNAAGHISVAADKNVDSWCTQLYNTLKSPYKLDVWKGETEAYILRIIRNNRSSARAFDVINTEESGTDGLSQ